MLRSRVIPCLQLLNENLVKTVRFQKPNYIGDFVNTVRIFNELEVDELCLLSIRATVNNRPPNFEVLKMVANECFMPLSYGGGITDFEKASQIFKIGYEKVILNSAVFGNPSLVTKIAEHFGSQSTVVSLDIKKNLFGKYAIYSHSGTKKQSKDYVEYAQKVEQMGAGELLLTSINQDGTWEGYNYDLLNEISSSVDIPVIINGGAGNLDHLSQGVHSGASGLGVGSMVVYQAKGMGVLINFPDRKKLAQTLGYDKN